jgi:hypothetical protein
MRPDVVLTKSLSLPRTHRSTQFGHERRHIVQTSRVCRLSSWQLSVDRGAHLLRSRVCTLPHILWVCQDPDPLTGAQAAKPRSTIKACSPTAGAYQSVQHMRGNCGHCTCRLCSACSQTPAYTLDNKGSCYCSMQHTRASNTQLLEWALVTVCTSQLIDRKTHMPFDPSVCRVSDFQGFRTLHPNSGAGR